MIEAFEVLEGAHETQKGYSHNFSLQSSLLIRILYKYDLNQGFLYLK